MSLDEILEKLAASEEVQDDDEDIDPDEDKSAIPDNEYHIKSKAEKKTVVWTRQDDGIAFNIESHEIPFRRTRIVWPTTEASRLQMDDQKSRLDYFMLAWPMQRKDEILSATNAELRGGHRPVKIGELFKYYGVLYLKSFYSNWRMRDLWADFDGKESVRQSLNLFNISGMTRERFEEIDRALRYGSYTCQDEEKDPWISVRFLVDAFNERRQMTVVPGTDLCIDECMCGWKGKNGVWRLNAMPHITKIIRKPVGIGLEFKSTSDPITGVLLLLEIAEDKHLMLNKEYADTFKKHVAMVLRLVKPWFGTGRIVHGDSGFASFHTATALLSKGLHFTGPVKTAHSLFPKKALRDAVTDKPKGTMVWATTTVGDNKVLAMSHVDKTIKTFISTNGSSAPGEAHERTYYSIRDGVETKCVQLIPQALLLNRFFKAAKSIDVHDHYRQGGLALEKARKTKNWKRRVHDTVHGMIEVDAFLLWKHDSLEYKESMDHTAWTDGLAWELLTNTLDDDTPMKLRRKRQVEEQSEESAIHEMKSLVRVPEFSVKRSKKADKKTSGGNPRLVCSNQFCTKRVSYLCTGCSKPTQHIFITYCQRHFAYHLMPVQVEID